MKSALISPSVIGLLFTGSPPAVFRTIWSIIVFAINAKVRIGLRPHIGIKVLKRFKPTLTNSNSTATVVGISFIPRFCAAIYNRAPYDIRLGSGEAVSAFALSHQFALKASTAFRFTCLEVSRRHDLNHPTLTSAIPVNLRRSTGNAYYSPSAKRLSSYILEIVRRAHFCVISHIRSHFRCWLGHSPISIIGGCLITFYGALRMHQA